MCLINIHTSKNEHSRKNSCQHHTYNKPYLTISTPDKSPNDQNQHQHKQTNTSQELGRDYFHIQEHNCKHDRSDQNQQRHDHPRDMLTHFSHMQTSIFVLVFKLNIFIILRFFGGKSKKY